MTAFKRITLGGGILFLGDYMKELDENKIYYIYAHYRPNDDVPFYIGKGHESRAWWKHARNNHWKNVVKKNGGFEVKLLLENLTEQTSLCMEAMYINAYGRADLGNGPLVNMTDGGEGTSGRKHTEKAIRIMRIKAKSRKHHKHDENTKRKMSISASEHVYFVSNDKNCDLSFYSIKELSDHVGQTNLAKLNWAIKRGHLVNGYNIKKQTKDGMPCDIAVNRRGTHSKFIWHLVDEKGEKTFYDYPKQIADVLNVSTQKINDAARRHHPKIKGFRIYKNPKNICH